MVEKVYMDLGESLEMTYLVEEISNQSININSEPSSGSASFQHMKEEYSIFDPSDSGIYEVEIGDQIVEIQVSSIPEGQKLHIPLKDSNSDGSAEVTDATKNNSISKTGSLTFSSSPILRDKYNGSADLSSDEHLTVDGPAFDFGTGDFCFVVALNIQSVGSSSNHYVVDTEGFGDRFCVSPTKGSVSGDKEGNIYDYGIGQTIVDSSNYNLNTNYVLLRNRVNGTEEVYLNSNSPIRTFSNTTDYSINGGRINHYGNGFDSTYFVNGYASDIRVYHRSLSQSEIQNILDVYNI